MQHDEVIWGVINQHFCSYKVKARNTNFCKNEYNVTGFCSRQSCPLANSRYATIKEINGVCYLYMKTIERAHTPSKMWERVKLSKNYMEALQQLDKNLIYWPKFLIHKCKQRLTKITQYLMKMRRLALKEQPKLVPINKKIERREARRELKAEVAAKLEHSIEKELLARLKEGAYGEMYEDIVNINSKAFETVMDEVEESDKEDELHEFVEYSGDEMSDMEDLEQEFEMLEDIEEEEKDEDEDEEEDEDGKDEDQKQPPKKKRKGPYVEIEYEHEPVSNLSTSRTEW